MTMKCLRVRDVRAGVKGGKDGDEDDQVDVRCLMQ